MLIRKKITIMSMVVLIAAFSACDPDLLDTPNPNEPTTATFWQSEEDAVRSVNATYAVLTIWGTYENWLMNVYNTRADDSFPDSPWNEYNVLGNFTYLPHHTSLTVVWHDLYAGIFRANQVIQEVPEMEIDPGLRDRVVGEARFLRGFFYFHLVNLYRNVPLILEPAQSSEDYHVPQASPEEVWNQIYADFSAAQDALPTSYSGSDIGRATWGAATAYLGRSYLYNEMWSDAASEFEDIIGSGLYQLIENYRDNFTGSFENNPESIFEIQFSGDTSPGIYNHRGAAYSPRGFGWNDIIPTQALFEAYMSEETVDGDDDPRAHATLFYNRPGMTIYGQPYEEVYGEETEEIFWRKYMRDTPGGTEVDAEGTFNIRKIRYADVLLMYAEAQNELGNQAAAAEYIQMVRDRANLPDRENEFAAYSQEQLRERIAHERFTELAGEEKRFLDIRRWGWFDDTEKLELLQSRHPDFEDYRPGKEWFPIPQDEMDTNTEIQQNPTY